MTAFTRAFGARTDADIAIEQARARGLSVEQTVAALEVDAARVQSVWAAMDETAATDDAPRPAGPRRWHSTAEHGTFARFQIHRGRGEVPCDPCREASRRREQGRRDRSRCIRADS